MAQRIRRSWGAEDRVFQCGACDGIEDQNATDDDHGGVQIATGQRDDGRPQSIEQGAESEIEQANDGDPENENTNQTPRVTAGQREAPSQRLQRRHPGEEVCREGEDHPGVRDQDAQTRGDGQHDGYGGGPPECGGTDLHEIVQVVARQKAEEQVGSGAGKWEEDEQQDDRANDVDQQDAGHTGQHRQQRTDPANRRPPAQVREDHHQTRLLGHRRGHDGRDHKQGCADADGGEEEVEDLLVRHRAAAAPVCDEAEQQRECGSQDQRIEGSEQNAEENETAPMAIEVVNRREDQSPKAQGFRFSPHRLADRNGCTDHTASIKGQPRSLLSLRSPPDPVLEWQASGPDPQLKPVMPRKRSRADEPCAQDSARNRDRRPGRGGSCADRQLEVRRRRLGHLRSRSLKQREWLVSRRCSRPG
jgi:hypothetical protein